jgi:hypothetical protein
VVCGVKVSCGPRALARDVSPELPRTPQHKFLNIRKFTHDRKKYSFSNFI